MSVRVYWKYYFGDKTLKDAVEGDPSEAQTVFGLTEENNLSVGGMSKFLIDRYNQIYNDALDIMVSRCWRYNQVYAQFEAEESTAPTLVVRKWMLDVQLPDDIKEKADRFVAKISANSRNEWGIINSLSRDDLKKLTDAEDFIVYLAWDIYRFRILEQFGAIILPVEDILSEEFWQDLKKRYQSSKKVDVRAVDEKTFVAKGSSGNYDVDIFRMRCSCPDFMRRGRRTGIQCKHLIAALRKVNIWHEGWGQYIAAIAT